MAVRTWDECVPRGCVCRWRAVLAGWIPYARNARCLAVHAEDRR
jgi:hypothetical protein